MTEDKPKPRLDTETFALASIGSVVLSIYLVIDILVRTEMFASLIPPALAIALLLFIEYKKWEHYTRRSEAMETIMKVVDVDTSFVRHMHKTMKLIQAGENDTRVELTKMYADNRVHEDIVRDQGTAEKATASHRKKANEVLAAGRELNLMVIYDNADEYARHTPPQ